MPGADVTNLDAAACDLGPAMILVNYRTGTVRTLIGATSPPVGWPEPVLGVVIEPSWGTQESQAAWETSPIRSIGLGRGMLAAACLAVTALVAGTGRREYRMRRLITLITVASRPYGRAATSAEATVMVQAVRAVTTFAPMRVACLEESTAAFLVLALTGRQVTWCHGVAADPIRLHAWIETHNGRTIAEPPATARCATLRTIPERARSHR